MAIDDALPIAKQIAEALEYAHERGVIHRDLKPANVKITPEGAVKVLDFGLAKVLEAQDSTATTDMANSPTLSAMATQGGMILGTAAYMSPEQARGQRVDRRCDIWAFGCVLYEMLSGRKPFDGETISDVLAAVIRAEPEWTAIPDTTPPSIQRLIRRCLVKDARQRLRDIGDARIAIEETISGTGVPPVIEHGQDAHATTVAPGSPLRRALPWALASVFALALIGSSVLFWRAERSVTLPVTKFALALSTGERPYGFTEGPAIALSPDGAKLAYIDTRAPSEIHLRRLDAIEDRAISGTEGAQAPFFSPDGRWIGFFAGGKLKKVSTEGGMPITLAEAQFPRGGTWAPDGTIIFSPSVVSGLKRVSDVGGNVETLTTPDAASGQRTHRWAEVLPGGKAVLFLIGKLTSPTYFDDSEVAALSLETRKYHVVLEHAAMARYAATSSSGGYIVYSHSSDLFALPFDPVRLEVTGQAIPVVQGVSEAFANGAAQFALSRNGSLIYIPGGAEYENKFLTWVDRKGGEHPIPAPPRPYGTLSLSPNGQRLAAGMYSTAPGGLRDIEIYDFDNNTLTRLTFTGDNEMPLWTPDGKFVAFYSARPQNAGLYWETADGSQPPELLAPVHSMSAPTSFSPDGKFLAYVQTMPQAGTEILVLPLEGDRKTRPFGREIFNEGWASFSPDGHWLAYMSEESGQQEIWVRPFPGPGGKWLVSSGGGNYPIWANSGRELFYANGDKLMSAPVKTSPTFSAGMPQALFQGPTLGWSVSPGRGFFLSKPFAVAPDGGRFLFTKQSAPPATQINVVLNWFEELRRLAADGKP